MLIDKLRTWWSSTRPLDSNLIVSFLLKSLNHENTCINISVFLSDSVGFLKCASV